MTKNTLITLLILMTGTLKIFAQVSYTPKHFVALDDSTEFIRTIPQKDGFMRNYLLFTPDIWDVDSHDTMFIRGAQKALVCIEGNYKNGLREGVYIAYLIDSFDHAKHYKIWERSYKNNKLNGQWKTYSLQGRMVSFQTFKNDSISGLARNYWVDGKTILEERNYSNTNGDYLLKTFTRNGKLKEVTPFKNNIASGKSKTYSPNGYLLEEMTLQNGMANGLRKTFYPSGKVFLELNMKDGKMWDILSNYNEQGLKRKPGTLKNGEGSIIYFNRNNTVKEIISYKEGLPLSK